MWQTLQHVDLGNKNRSVLLYNEHAETLLTSPANSPLVVHSPLMLTLFAGAVSAAARELRPIEIVALYENQKEAQDKELAAARAEASQKGS